ncbi:phosphotransferase [Dictyobacter halimunensis]|uniref:phosphotransferase n=1 Tax=Dictyobacter halimunensis TaxID=3026934 RepID=UPI0030C6B33D
MDEMTFFTTLLQEYDDLEAITQHQPSESSASEGCLVYHLRHEDGTTWVARAYQRDRLLPDWFRFFYPWATPDTAEWVWTRAATLLCLELQNYPAPRVLRTRAGALLSQTPEWCMIITTFIQGAVLQPTLGQLQLLGRNLGSLHALSPSKLSSNTLSPGKSYWDAEYAFSTVQAHLASVEPRLPAEWRSLHSEFTQTLQRLAQCPFLPRTVIHGDAWAANAVQISTDQAILIDWDTSGWGPAILDLGRLLLECHLDSDLPPHDPLAWHIQPDVHRIAAVVDGYAQQRRPTAAELDLLLDALRFGIAFIGTLHFTQALQDGTHSPEWMRGMQRRLARLQNRWKVSSEIASLARQRFVNVGIR